jgi:hypothetical protein
MHTSAFSSSRRYVSLFFSSSMLQLLHIMLLHACITRNSSNPNLFFVLCFYPLCASSACSMCNASACCSPCHCSSFWDVHCHSTLPQLHSLEHQHALLVLHVLLMLSPLPDHHHNSSASLVVIPMRSSSLGVMLRFLSLSSSRDSSSSLSHSISFPLLQLQAPALFHLSIVSTNRLHSTGGCLETLQLLWQSP